MTTIRNVMDFVMEAAVLPENTVDRLQFGNPDDAVKGIAVCFLANQTVIEQTARLGANLLISHEGIFYRHRDMGDEKNPDPVYIKKVQIIIENGIAVFRVHDSNHRCTPDGIMHGLLRSLSWTIYEVICHPHYSVLEIPVSTLGQILRHIKNCLGVSYLRYMGNTDMPCRRIGLLVGYRGSGETAIPLFHNENLDLMIYGEGPEWETPEYVRDSQLQGMQRGLIVLGHAESETPGMKYLSELLQEKFADIPIHFLPQEPVLKPFI
jgi:putative NIF3 family GTP cyclohydrolase 1 type 2